MITIAIANHKGGVAKTATTHTLGAGLAQLGWRVLLIDNDPQSSLTAGCGVTDAEGESLAEVIGGASAGTINIQDTLYEISDNLYLVPSDIALARSELGLVSRMGRENILKRALDTIANDYDVCLIDCPPSLGLLTINALNASNHVLVPTQPQITDLRGLKLFLDTVEQIRQEINPSLSILGILLTFYDSRLVLHRDAIELMQKSNLPVLKTRIGRAISVAEAPSIGQSILEYDPTNKQAVAYRALAQEVDQWLKR